MKNRIILGIIAITFCCCTVQQVTVEVINPSDLAHEKTTVEVAWTDITAKLPTADPAKIVVTCAQSGEELVSQVVFAGQADPQSLIFQVCLKAQDSAAFLIKEGMPAAYPAKTYGRHISERKDDFAWENDRVAFRMYGPALAAENPSNGVDIWMKKTDSLIVDKFYQDDLQNGKSYHIDHGDGLDCYKVGHALGAGGIAPYLNDTLWVGNHYVTQEIWDNGPIRTTFKLNYDNLPVGSKTFSEEIVISLDGGAQLNKAIVSFDGDFESLQIAGGIFLHEDVGVGNIKADAAEGYIAYGETATSDAGLPAGRDYVGVVFPGGITESVQQAGHLLALAPYTKGDKITYYFGGGWSNWGFENDDAWFNYVANFVAKSRIPLLVTVK
jgi:hypothetical protein